MLGTLWFYFYLFWLVSSYAVIYVHTHIPDQHFILFLNCRNNLRSCIFFQRCFFFFCFASARNLMGQVIWGHCNSVPGIKTFSIAQMICNWAAVGTRAGLDLVHSSPKGVTTFSDLCIPTHEWPLETQLLLLLFYLPLLDSQITSGKKQPSCWVPFSLGFCPLFHLDSAFFCYL